MNDLISRSALFRKSFVVDGHRVVSYLDIIEAPAAYDVDKVVTRMQKEFEHYYGEHWRDMPCLARVIEVVQGGGGQE